MKPLEPDTNGDGAEAARDDSGSGSGSDSEPEGGELALHDAAWPARALAALNALRKSRQHYDVVLVAGGAELAAHRAVLAAASPRLLRLLQDDAAANVRLPVPAAPLRALLDYVYTGRLAVRSPSDARALYRAAAELRIEAARAHLAERLLRRPAPAHALELRALPDLEPHHVAALDAFIADNFDEVCSSGALAALPEVRVEMMRDSSREGGGEAPRAVAEAALAWLLEHAPADLDELCARPHLLYVDARGALSDCGRLPPARGDAPELTLYRREAAERRAGGGGEAGGGARAAGDGHVVAASRGAGGGTRALLAVRGRAVGARLAWSDVAAGGGGVARGGALGGAAAAGERRARLAAARAAHGAAALGGRLLVCGGYDRARVLRSVEAYEAARDAWEPLPDMRTPRARFAAARLGSEVWALGGSDGQTELDSVDAYSEGGGWAARARLPAAVAHAGAAADEERGELYVVGGWCGGGPVKRVLRLAAGQAGARWTEAAALLAARAQCAAVWWEGALWALGGCDAWRCLASTERLARGAAAWAAGPALPTARRSVGGAEWRGRLVAAGGSDGAASLRRTEWLTRGATCWRPGPQLRRARAALGLAALDGMLYAAGGYDGAQFLSCVEVLATPDGQWTQLLHAPPPGAALQDGKQNGTHDAEDGACEPEDGSPDTQDESPDTQDGSPNTQDGSPDTQDGSPDTQDGSPDTQDGSPDTQDGSPDTRDGSPDTQDGSPRETQ